MDSSYFYTLLSGGVSDKLTVKRIVRGLQWTAAELSDGSMGIAMRYPSETIPRMHNDTLVGLSAREAAEAVLSWNQEESSEAMAVVNAWYNAPSRVPVRAQKYPYTDACTAGFDTRGKTIGLVGHLRLGDDVLAHAKQVYILERKPQPGDYPDPACDFLLPRCDVALITGSAFSNKTMPHLLSLCGGAKVIVVGPSTPLCPALLDCGVDRLCGLSVRSDEAVLTAIAERAETGYRYGDAFRLEK